MAELMLVNPRRRKRRRNPVRKMTAKQAKYFAPRKRKRRHSVARASVARSPRRVSRRRHRRSYRRATKSFAAAFSPKSLMQGTLMPAAIGAAGAVGFDVLWAMAPIPATLKTGPASPLVKIGAAVAAGVLVSKFVSPKVGSAIAAGAVLVTAYDVIKNTIRANVPQLPLSEYVDGFGYVSAGPFLPDAALPPPGMGAYVSQVPSFYHEGAGGDVIY